jgi:tetratricopeptide (TPR) repeat protein
MNLRDRLLIFSLTLAALIFTGAAPYLDSAEKGETAYEKGNYPESVEHFKDAIENGGDSGAMQYNLGNAQYKSSDYSEAESSYRRALDAEGQSPEEYYNLGNAIAMQAESAADSGDISAAKGLYQQAVEAYGKTLESDYTDTDAIHNLEYAKRRLQELKDKESSRKEKQDENSQSGEDSEKNDKSTGGKGPQQQDQSQSGGDKQEQNDENNEGKPDKENNQDENSKQNSGGKQQADDGLKYSDEYIDNLLRYYDQRERDESEKGINIPFIPDNNSQGGFWDQFFGTPPQNGDDWVDW